MKRLVVGLLVAVFALLSVAPAFAQDEFVFGMVLVGPKDDRGWSQAHFEGGQYIEASIPGARMLVFESLNPADTPETTLEDVVTLFVDEGARLIITTSDAFEEDTATVAAKFPEVVFINASGDDVFAGTAPANLGNVMAASEWPRLIAGCAAALTTQTGQLGYIGPLINAETRRVAASEYLGARYCWENYRGNDPADLVFQVQWIGFWFAIPGVTLDPTQEANTFYDQGFDVVISGIDTTEMVTVAGQRLEAGETVWSQPYNSLTGCDTAPDNCLGMVFYNWGPEYLKIAQAVIDGTWEQDWQWVPPVFDDMMNMELTSTGYMPGPGLSEENRATLELFIAEMQAFAADPANADAIFLWQGPLALQDGTVLAEEGENVPLMDIWYLPQLLDGMLGDSESAQ
ncbi:MAG: BMP family ABC transporter substrate-binding protein [Anaerolineae bacterium]|jgi:simple sugar transport system substrate-binding protein|nr:BMP family ABC transporter substrate-binding protein [Anaerolineae bacterium]